MHLFATTSGEDILEHGKAAVVAEHAEPAVSVP
jgi:hypothetical protein